MTDTPHERDPAPNPPYDPDGPDPAEPIGREDDAARREAERAKLGRKGVPHTPGTHRHTDPTGKDSEPEGGGAEPDPFKIA